MELVDFNDDPFDFGFKPACRYEWAVLYRVNGKPAGGFPGSPFTTKIEALAAAAAANGRPGPVAVVRRVKVPR